MVNTILLFVGRTRQESDASARTACTARRGSQLSTRGASHAMTRPATRANTIAADPTAVAKMVRQQAMESTIRSPQDMRSFAARWIIAGCGLFPE